MFKSIPFIFILFFTFTTNSESQKYADQPNDPRPSYGIFGNFGVNVHFGDFHKLKDIPSCCPKFESGFGFGYAGGLFYAVPISSAIELNFRAIFSNLSGKLSRIEPITLPTKDGGSIDGEFEHTLDAKITAVGLQPMVSLRLSDALRLSLGGRFGYILTKTYEQKEEIVNPAYGTFVENNSRTRNESSGDIPEPATLDAGIMAMVSFDLPLNASYTLFLVPEASFSWGLTEVSKETSWNVSPLTAGIGLRYAPREIVPPKPPPPPPPPPPLPPPPPPPLVPTLDASIEAVSLEPDGKEGKVSTLRVEEFLSTRMHPLLPYVFFTENSANLQPRYKRMTDQEKSEFSVKQLYNLKTLDVYYHLLNIVGKRMTVYPQSEITLVGCNSNDGAEKGNTQLSQSRAETVKNYLVKVWDLPESRIKIRTQNQPDIPSNPATTDGIEENRRVEIYSNMPQVLEPMIIRDTIRESNPPVFRFKPKVSAVIGVASWKIITSQSGGDLKVFSGAGPTPVNIDWNLRLEDEKTFIPRFDEPLKYKLQVVDNDNKVWESPVQTLPVEQVTIEKKMMEMVEDKVIDRFSLILFGFGRADLNEQNIEISNFAKKRITKSSTVTIKGFTDRVGDEAFNQSLSERRAQATAKALAVDSRFATGAGESILLYNNDLPEGRFYCRTVNIEIVTKIE